MHLLVAATLIWAFSFSLIGQYLAGSVDPFFSAWIRTALALAVFLPILFRQRNRWREGLIPAGIGGIQLGLMYAFYYQGFEFLTVPEVLIFTIITPIYVTLIDDCFERRFSWFYLFTASLAVMGAAVIRWGSVSPGFITGFFCIQACNLCFAFGQVAYKRWSSKGSKGATLPTFGFFFLGACVVSSAVLLIWGKPNYPTTLFQWGVLLWLGIIASGVGYFLWNNGARMVNAGALAIMNNALIPAGLLVNVVLWRQPVDPVRLGLGTGILLISLWINERYRQKASKTATVSWNGLHKRPICVRRR